MVANRLPALILGFNIKILKDLCIHVHLAVQRRARRGRALSRIRGRVRCNELFGRLRTSNSGVRSPRFRAVA